MSKQQSGTTRSKEVKIVTKQVVSLSDVSRDPRRVKLLYVISTYGPITEKALNQLIYELKEKGIDLKYGFSNIGKTPVSRDLGNDITMLKYTGLIEVNNFRKLTLSSLGKEFLEKNMEAIGEVERETLKNVVNELKPKIKATDLEIEIKFRKTGRERSSI